MFNKVKKIFKDGFWIPVICAFVVWIIILALFNLVNEKPTNDINGDGIINQLDVDMVRKTLEGSYKPTNEMLKRMDVNEDGVVSLLDLAIIKSEVNGNNDKYDVNADGVVDIMDMMEIKKHIIENGGTFQ